MCCMLRPLTICPHVQPEVAFIQQTKSLFKCTAMDVLCFTYCGCVSVLGKIRSAVGSAQLLMSQKFQQFYWLCQQNLVRNERLCVWACCVCFIVIYANCENQPFSVFYDATTNHESLKADIAEKSQSRRANDFVLSGVDLS